MKFQSVKEYFYKLNTIGFILLLIPLSGFIILYYRVFSIPVLIWDAGLNWLLLGLTVLLYLLCLTIVQWLWRERIRKLTKVIELASKLDGFAEVTTRRMAMNSIFSTLAAVGFLLTGSPWFTVMFLVITLITLIQWPTRSAFCRHLNLRGAERDMVMQGHDMIEKKRRAS